MWHSLESNSMLKMRRGMSWKLGCVTPGWLCVSPSHIRLCPQVSGPGHVFCFSLCITSLVNHLSPSISLLCFSPLFPHTFLFFSSHSCIQSGTDCQPLYIVSRNYKTPPPRNSESSSFFMQALRLILFSKVSDIWGERKCFDHFPDLWWSFLGIYIISILC